MKCSILVPYVAKMFETVEEKEEKYVLIRRKISPEVARDTLDTKYWAIFNIFAFLLIFHG